MSAQTVPVVVPLADIKVCNPCRAGFRAVKNLFPHGVPLTPEAVAALEDSLSPTDTAWGATRLLSESRLRDFVRWAAFRNLPEEWQCYQEGELPPLLVALEARAGELAQRYAENSHDTILLYEYRALTDAARPLTVLNRGFDTLDRLRRAAYVLAFPTPNSLLETWQAADQEKKVRRARLFESLLEQYVSVLRCDRCGVLRSEGEGGWLRATRVSDGRVLTRCPKHITRSVVYECGGSVQSFRRALVNGVAVRIPAPKSRKKGQ